MTIDGIEVGQGAGNVSTNTAAGVSALASNTTATNNTAVGYLAGSVATTGDFNTSFGAEACRYNQLGRGNSFFGALAGANTTSSNNTGLGFNALVNNTSGSANTAIGGGAVGTTSGALGSNTTGSSNTAIGTSAGRLITTGSNNTILGRYQGNSNGIDIRAANKNIVISDGIGNTRITYLSDVLVGTTPVRITGDSGLGGFALVHAYNTTGGSQGWWIVAQRSGNLTVVDSSNGTGLTVTFTRTGTGLSMQTSSGQLSAQVFGIA